MLLSLNKKKLKELSNKELSHSQTFAVAGATKTDDPSIPSNTGFKCFVNVLPGKASPKVKP